MTAIACHGFQEGGAMYHHLFVYTRSLFFFFSFHLVRDGEESRSAFLLENQDRMLL
jgi:hypothetical protein